MRLTRRYSISYTVCVIALLLLAACKAEPVNTARVEPAPPLRIVQLPITYSAVTHLADSQGFIRAEGLPYAIISVPAGPDLATALRANRDDAGAVGGIAVTPVVTMIAAGDHPVVIATTLTSNRQVKLVTFAQIGITSDPASLHSKRIGVTKNTNGDIYLSRLLKKGKVSDAQIVNGRPADLRALLIRGDIDAAVLWDPFVVQSERTYRIERDARRVPNRGDIVILVDPTIDTLAFNIVTTAEKLRRHRPELVKLLRSLVRSDQFIASNRPQAQAELEKWLNVEKGDLGDFFETTTFHVELDQPSLRRWISEELVWWKENHPDATVPADVAQYMDGSLMAEIDTSRVKR